MTQNEPQRKETPLGPSVLHQTHHHYYLNISVEAANLSDWLIESNRKNRFGSENRIESKLFLPELECSTVWDYPGKLVPEETFTSSMQWLTKEIKI